MDKIILTACYYDSRPFVFSVPEKWHADEKEKALKGKEFQNLTPGEQMTYVDYVKYKKLFEYIGGEVKEVELMSTKEVLQRWPRIISHLISESLGYFTPNAAANALKNFKLNEPYYCEWYCHMAQFRNNERDIFDEESVRQVTQDTFKQAIARRHKHKGYMNEYKLAREVVERELQGEEAQFASWF